MRAVAIATSLAATVTVAAGQPDQPPIEAVLARAGERVQQFFARAQRLVCLEAVRLMPLSPTWGSDGPTRIVESELRVSWAPDADGMPVTEARVLRQLLRVNGRASRENDWNNCTEPEQQSEEPQPLSLLLPGARDAYEFRLAGRGRVDRRDAVMVDYRHLSRVSVDVDLVEGRDDCISYDFDGGVRGRIWIDAETYDVLRLDSRLIGMIDVPLPREAARSGPLYLTLERLDTTIRFKPVTFTDPDETLVLPASMTTMRVTRGSGVPRLRTSTEYTQYRRFLTSGRIVGPGL